MNTFLKILGFLCLLSYEVRGVTLGVGLIVIAYLRDIIENQKK